MGQRKWVGACLLAVCALALQAGADESASSPSVKDAAASQSQSVALTDDERRSERAIESALGQPLKSSLDFVDTPLNTIMGVIQEEYGIPIQFDRAALEAAAASADQEISLNVRNITLRSAMDLMLKEVPDLTYIFDNEVLLITTEDEASKRLQTRVYRIDDLLQKPRLGREESDTPQFAPIVDVITRCVERDSWKANNTGEGEICIVEPGVMVVTQTQRVHADIERLLATVRRVKVAIANGPLPNIESTASAAVSETRAGGGRRVGGF